MPKTSKVKKSKKHKPDTYNAWLRKMAPRAAPTSKLDAARAAFDSAILDAVKACLVFSAPGYMPVSTAGDRAQDAGFALQDAAAALIRAREEHAPIPVKLTPKAEGANLKARKPSGEDVGQYLLKLKDCMVPSGTRPGAIAKMQRDMKRRGTR